MKVVVPIVVFACAACGSDEMVSGEVGRLTISKERAASLQEASGEELPPLFTVHTGAYFRLSALVVEQLNDVRDLTTNETFSFETGGGFTLAGGYRDVTVPAAFEIEYAFRRVNLDDGQDSRLNLHTLAANVLFDASDIIGPVGGYAGAGIGFTVDEVALRSSGGQTAIGIGGGELFWQAMAGVTVSVHKQAQLYAGVRWVDFGTYEDEEYRFHSESLNYEFGARFFF